MKKALLFIFFLALIQVTPAFSSCPPGNSEIVVVIVPDIYPQETSWTLTDMGGTVFASGNWVGDTVCVPTGFCVIFNIYDTFGDGIYAPGGYWVYVDSVLVANGSNFGFSAMHPIACAPGMYCSSPITISPGTYTAAFDNTFYRYDCTLTGTYNITTCGMNTCNTKIWVYDHCAGMMIDEGPAGTYAYNDDAGCGLQSDLNVIFMAGSTYYIRIGDSFDDCPGTIDFTFSYIGPIQGCTDPTACNYNPLATVDDGSCIYNPNPLCAGPDLRFDSTAFVNSLMMMTVTASTCDVNEGCVTGYGTRYVIAFTSKIDNIGTLDYYIGTPSSNPTMFNTVNCHGHAHYEGYGDYRLYDTNNNLIPVGHKNGFCVMDLCGFGQYNCGNMGISVNCYDQYGAGTQCQWVDVTNVPTGQYRLAIIVNSHHLPDGMNHYETSHLNNAVQVCVQLTQNTSGPPTFTVLPSCTPFVDCMGIPGGAAVPDCNGICAGPGIFGNINGDLVLDSVDVEDYAGVIEANTTPASTCNDLNNDGFLDVYDAALASWCIRTPHVPHPAGSNYNECNFPRNILNPNDTVGLSISNVNFTTNYVDVELLSTGADIRAYQFSLHGIQVSSVVSLADPVEFPVDIRQVGTTSEIFAISLQDSSLARNNNPQILCRIFFSAITDTMICLDNIREMVNQDYERTITYIYGPCWNSSFVGIHETATQFNIALLPNPVTGEAWVQLPAGYTSDRMEIIDLTGRVVSVKATPIRTGYRIDLSGLTNGVYVLKIYSGSQSGLTRFVKL